MVVSMFSWPHRAMTTCGASPRMASQVAAVARRSCQVICFEVGVVL
ncbi:uncharacterized protein SOCE836_054050 [Sorangium cellulosum]|uniref:Uncharacterized protein n=1 Tax=Sorangium cellulosum TaxID=56 RepID=A0A4P2QT98_SORCE|nr:uncharacterized protein SOCE836_054050 [Sorangium cellulosum]